MRAACFSLMLITLGACTVERTAIERGESLFHDPTLSPSTLNKVTCGHCHATADDDTRILAGAPLNGVTGRTEFFGGREVDLRRAVNYCIQQFMRSSMRETLKEDDERGRDLLEYLSSLEGSTQNVEWSIPEVVNPLDEGDATRGAGIYERACVTCHGDRNTGLGRLSDLASVIPAETIEEHDDFAYIVTLQKIRWGQFHLTGGDMAPFAPQMLSDAQLSDLIAYLGLHSPTAQ